MASYGNNLLFYQMLVRNDVPPQSALGALTSLMGESGSQLDPRSMHANDAGPGLHSVGMGQWNRERLAGLTRFAQAKGTDIYDPATQVGFAEHELNTTHKGVLAQLRQADDVGHGARVWTGSYEGPKVNNWQQRLSMNLPIANKIGAGTTAEIPLYAGEGPKAEGVGGLFSPDSLAKQPVTMVPPASGAAELAAPGAGPFASFSLTPSTDYTMQPAVLTNNKKDNQQDTISTLADAMGRGVRAGAGAGRMGSDGFGGDAPVSPIPEGLTAGYGDQPFAARYAAGRQTRGDLSPLAQLFALPQVGLPAPQLPRPRRF